MHFSKEKKAKLLEDWRESGKSISAFVKENGLVRWTFTKWLNAERNLKPCFVEIPTEAIQATARAGQIVIEKGEVRIHIPLGLSSKELRAVVEGLGVAL